MASRMLLLLSLIIALQVGCACESPPDGDAAASANTASVSASASEVAASGEPTESEAFDEARAQHLLGVAGDADAARAAYDTFMALHEAYPRHPLLKAYAGSAALLRSRDEVLPWNKGKYAKRGVIMMNEAIEAAPDDVDVRLIRAASTAGLPAMLKLDDLHAADVAWLVERLQSPAGQAIAPADAAHIALMKGNLQAEAGHADEARRWWRKAVTDAPDSRAGLRAAEALAD